MGAPARVGDLVLGQRGAGAEELSRRSRICLVCGQQAPLLDTIPEAVKSGAIPAGNGRSRDAQLVSVNKPAQGRGGKIQLASAPVCDSCGSAAMSALNALLADAPHRHRSADSVLVWWLREPADFNPLTWLDQPEPQQVEKLIEELDRAAPAPPSAAARTRTRSTRSPCRSTRAASWYATGSRCRSGSSRPASAGGSPTTR